MAKNTLVLVGYLGSVSAYLNVSEDEALRRWEADRGDVDDLPRIQTLDFDDEFVVYDAWTK